MKKFLVYGLVVIGAVALFAAAGYVVLAILIEHVLPKC